MRDWLVILIIAILSVAVGVWALRSRPAGTNARTPEPRKNNTDPIPSAAPQAAPQLKPLAVLEFEGEPGRVVVSRAEVVIGRHSEDDIQVHDVRVSRHHARLIARRDGRFEIHNLTAIRSEPNPMLVNGETREHADLGNGDVVTLGGVSFTLWLKAA